MTAQAFLLAIAFGATDSRSPKVVAAILGLVLSGLSMQLMAKHRFIEILDNRLLESVERKLDVETLVGQLPHAAIRDRISATPTSWFVRIPAYRMWMIGLLLFALTDIAAAVISVRLV